MHRTELITSHPVDTDIVGCQRLRVHIGLLITHTQPDAEIHTAYFGGHVDLSVRRHLLFRGAPVCGEGAGRAETCAAIAHIRRVERLCITARHQLLSATNQFGHVKLVVLSLQVWVGATGNLVKGASTRRRRHQVGNRAGLRYSAPGVTLHYRTRRPVVHFGHLDTKIDAVERTGVRELK